MIKKYVLLIFVLMMLLFVTGCFLDIKEDVDYPAGLFKQTHEKIRTIHAKDPGRKGPVSNLNLLVYIGEERKSVHLSVPITSVKDAAKGISNLENLDEKGEIGKFTKKIGGIKPDKLEILDRLGPGLVMQVEVEEGKDKVYALIWLD